MSSEVGQEPVDPRILFAAERTFLAYIRTGLALMGFGFVVARFALFLRQISTAAGIEGRTLPSVPNTGTSLLIGTALVIIGVIVCGASAPWYLRTVARLQCGQTYTPARYGVAVLVAFAVAMIGVLMAAYLLLLR
jgi:putative membrane protein